MFISYFTTYFHKFSNKSQLLQKQIKLILCLVLEIAYTYITYHDKCLRYKLQINLFIQTGPKLSDASSIRISKA